MSKNKIMHMRASTFHSVFANGMIISYVPNSGLINLTFYEDVFGVVSETLTDPDAEFSDTVFNADDIIAHREDKVRLSLPMDTARVLYQLLKERFEPAPQDPEGGDTNDGA